MKVQHLLLTCCFGLMMAIPAFSQTTYQLYLRLTDGSGVIAGPVSSIPNVTGGSFFPLGCTEHQISRSAGVGMASHDPYLLTRNFDPSTSPYLRQQMNLGGTFTVEVFMVEDNGSTPRTIFGTRLENAIITRITIGADANALQETYSFEYARIFWTDVQSNSTRGWDIVNDRAL